MFNGTILAQISITIKTGATLNGRALARIGAVTLDSNTMVNPGAPITTATPPTLTAINCPLPAAVVGAVYNSLLVPTGGTAPYTFTITPGSLPAGLNLNATTGAVTGTPTGAGGLSSFSTNATDSETPTPVTATNNTCGITVTPSTSSADVSINKTGPATVAALANITYILAVANAGPIAAAGVTVTDILPAGTTFVSAASPQGPCSFTGAVICTLGTIANGGSATVAITVAGPNSAGPIVNTATVVSTTPDPITGNNTSTWTVTVTTPPSVPTLSDWGLGLLALLLAGCSVQFIRKAHLRSIP
jgi:uncharacterized repeat protein (TIGR01451 family)